MHTFVVVAIARVYFGYHYPTDILAGAVLGIGLVSLIHVARVRAAVTRLPLLWMDRHPQSFQTALCVLIFLVATTFEPLYPLSHFVFTVAKPAIRVLDARMLSGVAFIAVLLSASAGYWVFERALTIRGRGESGPAPGVGTLRTGPHRRPSRFPRLGSRKTARHSLSASFHPSDRRF